jgi:hypothetical protein
MELDDVAAVITVGASVVALVILIFSARRR